MRHRVGARGKAAARRRASTAVRHSAATPDWGTPELLVEPARAVLGAIDLDPASSEEHNRRIRARRIFTAENDGLKYKWRGRVFLNPPGSEDGSLVKAFWRHLVGEWDEHRTQQAIWVGFSLEQLLSLQKTDAPLMPFDFPMCFLRTRVKFVDQAGGRDRPSHGNYVVYLPPPATDPDPDAPWSDLSFDASAVRRFDQHFAPLGRIVRP